MGRHQGLTLVEMMTALAVIAIVGSLAAPTFQQMRLNGQRTASVNNFFHSLFLARSEAVKRGEIVSLCRSADGQMCAPRTLPWTIGWIVFVNRDRDEPAIRDEDEEILSTYPGWQHGTITSNRVTYSFRPTVQGVVNGTIVFCDQRGSAHARAIIISHTGRPRVAHKSSSGKALKCQGEGDGG